MKRNSQVWGIWSSLRLAVLMALCVASNSCAVLDGFLSETRIVFHGVVVDQFGTPVEGASVNYEVESFSLPRPGYRTGTVKTGKDGKFTIRNGRGSRFFINDIICERYVYPLSGPKLRSYEFRSSYTDCFKPDSKRPEIFRLRKKEKESVFLYENVDIKCELDAREEGERWRGWDLRCGDSILPRFRNDPDFYNDLEFTWEYDMGKMEWTVHVKANGQNAGFQLRDEALYVAPQDGYEKERTFKFKNSDKLPVKYIYLRLRDPGMYCRLEVKRAFTNGTRFFIECNEYVNPFGDRYLEPLVFDWQNQKMGETMIDYRKKQKKQCVNSVLSLARISRNG